MPPAKSCATGARPGELVHLDITKLSRIPPDGGRDSRPPSLRPTVARNGSGMVRHALSWSPGRTGSGKSSFFDALSSWHKLFARGNRWDDDYHLKVYTQRTPQWNQKQLTVTFHHAPPNDSQERKKLIYTRSAFRNDPEFQTERFQRSPDPLDESRVNRMIDNDVAIRGNYQRLVGQVFDIFDAEPTMTTDFTESLINLIRDPVSRLFPELILNSLANPMEDGTFRFTKKGQPRIPLQEPLWR